MTSNVSQSKCYTGSKVIGRAVVTVHVLSSAGASILAVAYLLPLIYLLWSLKWGARAPANPWRATGLEWKTASPPPEHNFDEQPTVDEGPYNYPRFDQEAAHV